MVAQLHALPGRTDSDDPRGKRYTSDAKEAAYLTWRANGRSITKAADAIGATEATVGNWKRSEDWGRRADREDRVDQDAARNAVASTVAAELAKSLRTVVEIRDDPNANKKDRLAAAFFLLGIAGIAPVAKADASLFARKDDDTPAE